MRYLILLALFWGTNVKATQYKLSGSVNTKVQGYTDNSNSDFGNYFHFNLEQKAKFSEELIGVNQLRSNAQSRESDIRNKVKAQKKSDFETYLGENYIRYKNNWQISQVGFQEITWGEAFGQNYADIINPKDNRVTLYDDQNETKIPICLFNTKLFYTNGSVQLIYGAKPAFSKNLPVDLFLNSIPQGEISIQKESAPGFFNESEYGLKFSHTFSGLDLSFSYFDYLDRSPYYEISSATANTLILTEKHTRINSKTFSLTKTFFDFVFRSDFILHESKKYNYLNGSLLDNYLSNTFEYVIGIDSPTYNNNTFYFIVAGRKNDTIISSTLLPVEERYLIFKLSRQLGNEKTIDFSFTTETFTKGNGIQTQIFWPVSNTTELKFGGEFYFGDTASNMSKIKTINNIFFGLKNHFDL